MMTKRVFIAVAGALTLTAAPYALAELPFASPIVVAPLAPGLFALGLLERAGFGFFKPNGDLTSEGAVLFLSLNAVIWFGMVLTLLTALANWNGSRVCRDHC
jgi:hypothetical protein